MTTTHTQTELDAAGETLYAQLGGMLAANRWNGADLHFPYSDRATLRITREDPEGDYWIATLSRNGTVQMHATVAGNASTDTIVAIARAVWFA